MTDVNGALGPRLHCARVLRGQGDAKGAERFAKGSTDWMRHSHANFWSRRTVN